jgi:hypothetical protein
LSHWTICLPFHRRGLHRAQVDQRLGRDDHPARVLGLMARQSPGVAGELDERIPARRAVAAGVVWRDVALEVVAVLPGIDRPCEPLDLAGRQAERLGEVAHRRAHLEGREGGHERAAVAPVAVVDARDQDVADVAREVEVDVRQRGQLLVEEAAQQQLVLDRVDVREAGEVADDRGHARAAPAPRREQAPRRLRPAHLERHLARELEHVAVEQEEAGQAEVADHVQLLVEPPRGLLAPPAAAVTLLEHRGAELRQLAVGVRVLGAGVAVAEVLGQIEREPFRKPAALLDGIPVLAEALEHPLGRGQHVGGVAAAARLGLVERPSESHRDHRVLQRDALARVRVDVAGGDAGHTEPFGEL